MVSFGVSSGDVTLLTFTHIDFISSCLLSDSSIMMGVCFGACGFPYLILMFLLVLKYRGVFIFLFLLELMGVLKAAMETTTSFLMGSTENLGDISSSSSATFFSQLVSAFYSSSPSFSSP